MTKRIVLVSGLLLLSLGVTDFLAAAPPRKASDPDNAVWAIRLGGFFPPGRKGPRRALPVYVVRREGKWITAFGSAPEFNQTTYPTDPSGLSLTNKRLRGTLKLKINPDPWVPADQKPISCVIEVEAQPNPDTTSSNAFLGTYKGMFGADKVAGSAGVQVRALDQIDAQECAIGLTLNNALVGAKENYQERIYVKFKVNGRKATSAEFGLVGLDNRPYDLRPFAQFDFTSTLDTITGEFTVPYEVLGALGDPAASYHFKLHGVRVQNMVGGEFTVKVSHAGQEITKEGNYKGTVMPGVRQSVSIWEKDIKSDAPWFVPVKGYEPLQPGEHPRLFFRKSDLPGIKRRAATPEGQAIVARLKATLGGGEAMPTVYSSATQAYDRSSKNLPEGAYTLSHAAGFGMLYQLTGEKKYADLGRQCVEQALAGQRDRDDRYSFRAPGGQLRAGPTLGWYALGYDLCYDAWDDAFRRKIALELQDWDDAKSGEWAKPEKNTLAAMCLTPHQMPACNHWGSTLGVGLAVLALLGDPGTDALKLRSYLAAVEKNSIRGVTAGFGDGGFYSEGPGPSHMMANPALVPLFQAFKVALGKDYINARPNASWMTLRWIMELLPGKDGNPVYPCRKPSNYGSENFLGGNGGMSHGGWFSQGFGAIPEEQKPALLWVYQNFCASADVKGYDTVNYPHRAVLALVNWPIGVAPKNPAETMPKTHVDKIHGYYVFRNQWKDQDDVIVTAWLGSGPVGNMNPGSPDIMVWGLGQRLKIGTWPKCQTTYCQAEKDGSGVVSGGGLSMAVDFSGDCGAPALVALAGKELGKTKSDAAGLNLRDVSAGATEFRVLTLQKGEAPEIRTEGDTVRVGKRTLAHDGGKIVLK